MVGWAAIKSREGEGEVTRTAGNRSRDRGRAGLQSSPLRHPHRAPDLLAHALPMTGWERVGADALPFALGMLASHDVGPLLLEPPDHVLGMGT